MGKIGRGTRVRDGRGLQFSRFSSDRSPRLGVRDPISARVGTVQFRAPGSNRSARRR